MNVLPRFAAFAFVLALAAGPARADTPLVIGYTNVSDCVAAFVAKEEGFFAKRGLDVELRPMQNSAIEATSIVAGALQVGWWAVTCSRCCLRPPTAACR
jgi:NitT/TauT family transport system substrate-binding protein